MKEFGQPQATTEALFLSSLFWKKIHDKFLAFCLEPYLSQNRWWQPPYFYFMVRRRKKSWKFLNNFLLQIVSNLWIVSAAIFEVKDCCLPQRVWHFYISIFLKTIFFWNTVFQKSGVRKRGTKLDELWSYAYYI